MTRAEHLQWCKDRALECAEVGDLAGAVASMLSDMGKHDETAPVVSGILGGILMLDGMRSAQSGDHAGVRRWVEGFN